MKKAISLTVTLLVVFCLTGNALAFTDYSLNSETFHADMWMSYTKSASSSSFTLQLTDLEDARLTSAILVLNFEDDGGAFDLFEYASISYGNESTWCEVESGDVLVKLSSDGLTALNANGHIEFTLSRMYGDFTFRSASLTATTKCTTPVPVPSTIWLIGPTLIGFVGVQRRFSAMGAQGS